MTAPPVEGIGTQLPLVLRFPPDQRFTTFVGAPDGAVAQLQALVVEASRGCVYLCGPAASGKTHLALATCAEVGDHGKSAAYLPLVSTVGRLRDALHALHENDVIALDGLDDIAGNRDDEIALFDFHNRAHDAGKSILYAARVAPDALPLVLPDLRSRLAQCTRFTLRPLDDDGRRELLRLRARRRGLAIDEPAIDWLLRRVDRDISSLTALLDRLDRASLAAQRRITVPFLRQVLGIETG